MDMWIVGWLDGRVGGRMANRLAQSHGHPCSSSTGEQHEKQGNAAEGNGEEAFLEERVC